MRVLHLIPALSAGGAERQLQYLAQGLSERGHQVHVAYLRAGPDAEGPMCAQLHRIVAANNYDPRIPLQLWRLVGRVQPDIVQSWIVQMDILGGMVCGRSGAPWIIREPNSALAYHGSWKFRVRERVGRWASAIVCNSQGGREYWLQVTPRKPVFVVENSLPLDAIRVAPAPAANSVGVDPRIPLVVYAGRLVGDYTSDKNLKRLLEAMRTVVDRTPAHLLICGEGPQRLELEAEIRRLCLGPHVRLCGRLPREQLWGLLKLARVFVSVSRFEGMPNAVMEAIAVGCPLVVSDIGAHRELVPDDGALFARADQTGSIADAIVAVLARPEEANTRAARASRKASSWMPTTTAVAYEKVYEAVLSTRSRRAA